MTRTQEIEMNTNENIRNDTSEEIIELGVASVETQGGGQYPTEFKGGQLGGGITEE